MGELEGCMLQVAGLGVLTFDLQPVTLNWRSNDEQNCQKKQKAGEGA